MTKQEAIKEIKYQRDLAYDLMTMIPRMFATAAEYDTIDEEFVTAIEFAHIFLGKD